MRFQDDHLVESPRRSSPLMQPAQAASPTYQETKQPQLVHFSEDSVEKDTSPEKPKRQPPKQDDAQCGYYRSLLSKMMVECQRDSSKVQDLGELIFEIRQQGLEEQIDLAEAEDLVFQD
jgi:hypothetical protein